MHLLKWNTSLQIIWQPWLEGPSVDALIRWDDATMLVACQSCLLESPKDWDGLHGPYGSFGLDAEFLFACCGCPVLLESRHGLYYVSRSKGWLLGIFGIPDVWHFYPATSKSNFPLITKLRRLLVSIEFNWTPMIWSVKAWWSASGAIAERVSLWRGQVRWWTIYLVPSVDGMIDYIAFPVHRELLSDHQSKSFLVKNYLSSHSSIWISISLNRSNHPGSHSDILRSILVILAPKLVIQPLWYQKKFTHFGSFSIKRNLRSLVIVQSNTTSWGVQHMHRISCPWWFSLSVMHAPSLPMLTSRNYIYFVDPGILWLRFDHKGLSFMVHVS